MCSARTGELSCVHMSELALTTLPDSNDLIIELAKLPLLVAQDRARDQYKTGLNSYVAHLSLYPIRDG